MDILYRYGSDEFVWDSNKALRNRRKHGISFEEACEVFYDPFRQGGDASDNFEARDFVIGFSLRRRLLVAVHTERGTRTRIISARKATNHERMIYEDA